jgi:hypothetical protein
VLLVGVAAFVIVDIFLVVLAVDSVHRGPGPASPQPAQKQDSASTGTTSVGGQTTAAATVHLDAETDGSLLRATRGDCEQGPAAKVEISPDGGRTFRDVNSPVAEVLRVEIDEGSDAWLVGLDDACAAGFYRSSDAGQTWDASAGTAGAWHVLPEDEQAVHAPNGRVVVGCEPDWLAAVDFEVAVVGCADDRLLLTRDSGRSWVSAGRVPGLVSASFSSAAEGVAVGATTACAARVWSTTNSGTDWAADACVPGPEPALALDVTDGATYLQRGGDLLAKTDNLGFRPTG